MSESVLPRHFIWRRIHSLAGLWLLLFLVEHLLVNSQAALLLGESGRGFVEMVNSIHQIPYLQWIEFFLLAVPIGFHGFLGIRIALEAKCNSCRSDGTTPYVVENRRNRAFTWQRLTSWMILIGILIHVVHFRFLAYPSSLYQGEHSYHFVTLSADPGLYTVASRLGVSLYDKEQVIQEKQELEETIRGAGMEFSLSQPLLAPLPWNEEEQQRVTRAQQQAHKKAFVDMLGKQSIDSSEVVAVAKDFGTASLLNVRDAFKNPLYAVAYTLFVAATCFHAANGLWTFCMTWGVLLKRAMQQKALYITWGLMALLSFFGIASIWGTYWLNLRL